MYRDFRQKPGIARNESSESKRPGRSRWPEPDSIRRITGQHAWNHSPTHAVQRGFPRADLGLPIIFHFKDRGDPADATLHGPADGLDRFASPVITKAEAVDDGYRPLVLVLNAPHVWQFGDLRLNDKRITQTQVALTREERGEVPPLGGEDVREALIRHVEKCWNVKREVLP